MTEGNIAIQKFAQTTKAAAEEEKKVVELILTIFVIFIQLILTIYVPLVIACCLF